MPRVKNQLRGSFRRSFRDSTTSPTNDASDISNNNNNGETQPNAHRRRRRSSVAVVSNRHSGGNGSSSAAVYAAERRSSLAASVIYVNATETPSRQQTQLGASPSTASLRGSAFQQRQQQQQQQQYVVSPTMSLSPSVSEYYELAAVGAPQHIYRFSQQQQQPPLQQQLSGSASATSISASLVAGSLSASPATVVPVPSSRRTSAASSACTVDALQHQYPTHALQRHRVIRRKSSFAHQQLFQTQLSIKEQQRKPDILWRYDDDAIGWYITYGDGDAVTLLHTKRERAQMKNFATEIRALQDMEKFLLEATILLDVDEYQPLHEILLNLSRQMLTTTPVVVPNYVNNNNNLLFTTNAPPGDNNMTSSTQQFVANAVAPPPVVESVQLQHMRKNPTHLLFQAQKDTTTTLLNVVDSSATPPPPPSFSFTGGSIKKGLHRTRSNTLAATGASTLSVLQPNHSFDSVSRRPSANLRIQILPTIAFDDGEPSVEFLMKEVEATLFAHNEAGELARQIQGVIVSADGVFQGYDQAWICVMCILPSLQRRCLGIVRLRRPANFGNTCQECQYIILVFAPQHEKATKTALETGRTFSTLFADMLFRHDLSHAKTVAEFREKIRKQAELLAEIHGQAFDNDDSNQAAVVNNADTNVFHRAPETHNVGDVVKPQVANNNINNIEEDPFSTSFRSQSAASSKQQRRRKRGVCELLDKRPGKGLQTDFLNRLRVYVDDFRDGFVGSQTIPKTISTTCFLYFACLLPTIAFGTLHHSITKGQLGVRKAIIAQAAGGLIFSVFGGQPLVVLLTTAPIALYINIIFNIAEDLHVGFLPFYCCVGLWNALLLIIYSVTGACQLMKWSTRSTEEIFAVFVSITFAFDAVKAINENFNENYYSDACKKLYNDTAAPLVVSANGPESPDVEDLFGLTTTKSIDFIYKTKHGDVTTYNGPEICQQEVSLLYLLLIVGTVLISLWLYTFNKTPYLGKKKRELLTAYSLPLAVVIMSFIGSHVFQRVAQSSIITAIGADAGAVDMSELSWSSVVIAFGLSVPLSLLFYIDQNVSSAMVNSPVNKLRKPPAYHLDLLVVGLINALLSYFGLPWLHGALPHSPMHVHCLAELEQRVEDGHAFEIVIRVRETRITTMVSHLFIALSIFLLPYPLAYIPPAVLNGLFLYMAFTALNNLDLWDRICSCFYEKRLLPPQTYFRHVPLLKINIFTALQLLQLATLCAAGFAPVAYAKLCFPVLIMILIPIRQNIIPKIIEPKYLACLDGHNV